MPVKARDGKAPDGRGKAAERVAAELRREIAVGNLRPGDRLNSERLLQEQFEISRPTLREALRMLESESLIEVTRGQHGGARVTPLDMGVVTRQVGVCLQIEGATIQDVWEARTFIEPAAASILTRNPNNAEAIAALEENLVLARRAVDNAVDHGLLANDFSRILTETCGNTTIRVLATLIQDIVRLQHVNVAVRTYAKDSAGKMRSRNVSSREKMLSLIRKGDADAAHDFWKKHLEVSGGVVFSNYQAKMPIDVLRSEE